LTGNDALATRFPYVTEVSMNNNLDWWTGSGTRVNGPLVNIYGNANATWEKSKKLNLGVDMTLLESMDITIDYFKEDRSGIFMQRSSVPSTMGVTGMLPYANIGSVKNKGVDMSVAYSKVIGKDWVLRLNGSLTYAHNEITEIDEPVNVEPYSSRIGHPINSIMGYVSDGLFTSQEEIDRSPKQSFGNYTVGDIKYKDLNGDNVVNGYDRTIIGNPEIPEIIYGFGGTLKYKKWDLSLFFQGVAKVSLMMSDIHPFSEAGHKGYNIAQYIVDDHWSESNNVAGAAYPRLSPEFITNNAQTSTYYLRNAAFLRLKNAELGYSFFPWLRVYAAGTNLLTFSPFSTWDPEMGSGNGLKYPLQRTAKIGIQFHY
jgi:TonB-linked SusC/RagA family outer membrane protein